MSSPKHLFANLILFLLALGFLHSKASGQSFGIKLTASDGAENDHFGMAVDLDGTTAIVGAPDADPNGGGSGAAYVYNTTTGNLIKKLLPDDGGVGDKFGASVGIWGNIAIVGAPGDNDDGSNSGSAYLFNVTTGAQLHKLTASNASSGDAFGTSVAIYSNVAAVGAPSGDSSTTNGTGSAYLFDVASGAEFRHIGGVSSGDDFGRRVALDATSFWVTSPFFFNGDAAVGVAYRVAITAGPPTRTLSPVDAITGDLFGSSLAISADGSRTIIGHGRNAPVDGRRVYFFLNAEARGAFDPGDAAPDSFFGGDVAIDGDTFIVGASREDFGGLNTGSLFIYDLASGLEITKVIPSDVEAGDQLGFAVALRGNTILVSAPRDDDEADDAGAVYIGDLSTLARPEVPSLEITHIEYDASTRTSTLTWRSRPLKTYDVKKSDKLSRSFLPAVSHVSAQGTLTTASYTFNGSAPTAQFFFVEEQP